MKRFISALAILLWASSSFADELAGDNLVKEGKLREALDVYLSEVRADPRSVPLREKIMDLVKQLDPKPVITEEAKRAMARGKVEFEKAASPDMLGKAADEFSLASELAPWWPDAYYNLGLVEEKRGNYQDAIDQLNLYLYAMPNAPDADGVKGKIYELEYKKDSWNKAVDLNNQGIALLNQSRFQEALPIFKEALSLAPDSSYGHAALGYCLDQLGRYQEAISEFEEADRLGMKDLFNYVRFALVYYHGEQNYDAAIEVTERGLQMDPTSSRWPETLPMAYFNLGTYYSQIGNYPKAIENYEKAIQVGHHDVQEIRRRIQEIS